MNRKEIDLLLARIEGLKSFLEKNSLEDFQKEILRVDNYLKRFGSLDELLSHLKRVEEVAYTAKEFLTIDEVAYYLQVSKSYVYKLTASREFTVYKPNGKTIFVRRDDLNEWIRRNPCVSGREIERNLADIDTFLREVSIHALLAECDSSTGDNPGTIKRFNPRTPCGVRLLLDLNCKCSTWFQSTHSLRSATNLADIDTYLREVSIHALLAECD